MMRSTVLAAVVALLTPSVFGDLVIDPATAPADAARFHDLLAKCEGESSTFRELMEGIRRSDRPVLAFPGRNQPGVLVDAFGPPWPIDLADLDRFPNPKQDEASGRWIFPSGVDPRSQTLCENLAHALWERFHNSYVGGGFESNHESAIDFQSGIRRDFGQVGEPVSTQSDGVGGAITVNRPGFVEHWSGPRDQVGHIDVRDVAVLCTATCQGAPPRLRVRAADATCAACEAQLVRLCNPAGISSSVCSSAR